MTVENTRERGGSDGQERLLVVDDDAALRDLLERYLTQNGYSVATVNDGEEMDAWLSENSMDLVILDLMLPGEDGLSLARRLRAQSSTPILMLSARGEDVDRIIGLEMGADDYLAKPFNPRELLARVRALLRRSQSDTPPPTIDTSATPQPVDSEQFAIGAALLDCRLHTLSKDGEVLQLTAGEVSLLKVFVTNPGVVLSRDELHQRLKGFEQAPFDRSIDVRVTRLRRKIEPDPSNPVHLRTIWGKGYLFSASGEPAC